MSGLSIRTARAGDGPAIAAAWLDAGRHYIEVDPARFQVPQEEGLDAWFEASLPRLDGERTVLVAEAPAAGTGGPRSVIGFIAVHLEPPHTEPWRQLQRAYGVTRLHVDALAVIASRRRDGVGTLLMKAAEAWGTERGARMLLVDSFADGPTSTPFYERRMGYRRRSIRFEGRLG